MPDFVAPRGEAGEDPVSPLTSMSSNRHNCPWISQLWYKRLEGTQADHCARAIWASSWPCLSEALDEKRDFELKNKKALSSKLWALPLGKSASETTLTSGV